MRIVDSKESLMEVIPDIQQSQMIGLDVEASGLDPYTSKLLLIQIATTTDVYVINAGRIEKSALLYLFKLIEDAEIMCIAHQSKMEIKMIYHNYGVLLTHIFDTMIAEVLQYAGVAKPFNSLAFIAKKYLGVEMSKSVRDEFLDKKDFDFTEEQLNYAALDAGVMIPIYEAQKKLLEQNQGADVWDLEMKLVSVVAHMEYTGVFLDATAWSKLAEKAERKARDKAITIKNYLAKNFDILAGDYHHGLEAATNLCLPVRQMKVADRKILEDLTVPSEIINKLVPMINLGSSKQALHVLHCLGVETKSSSQKACLPLRSGQCWVSC